MSKYRELLPVTENPPAKVKDSGVVNMVKAGAGAYNAKTSELLLLPLAEKKRGDISAALREALFDKAGFQIVGCGNDQAILSLAERYIREWKESATAFQDSRGRSIRVVAWHPDMDDANIRMLSLDEALKTSSALSDKTRLVENCEATGFKNAYLLAPGDAGTLGGVAGFTCDHCGEMFLPDTPYKFTAAHPGAGEDAAPLEDVETPGANTIKDLCAQLGIGIEYTLKAMLYIATDGDGQNRPIASFVRGDFNVSMAKLSKWLYEELGFTGLRTAEKAELFEMVGEVAGYCGPVGLPKNVTVVCDSSVVGSVNTVVGANRPGYHKKGCCHNRDFAPPIADIAQLTEGVPCSCGSGSLNSTFFRVCGSFSIEEKKEGVLAYRDREGSHEYPYVLSGDISTEALLLASFSV